MKSSSFFNEIIESHPIHYTLLFDWILKSIPDIFLGLNSQSTKDKHVSLIGIPDLRAWLKLYRKSKHIIFSVIIEFCEHYSEHECFLSLIYFHLFLSKDERESILKEEIDKYNLLSEFDKKMYMAEVRSFQKNLKNESDNIIKDDFKTVTCENIGENLSQLELMFLIYVIMPSLMIHGELPSSLMRKAHLGDIEALEKLVQIDKSCIYGKRVSRVMHEISFSDKKTHKSICNKISKNTSNLSKAKIKTNLIGLLSKISKIYGKALSISPLTSEQIRFRFDYEAKNQGLGLIDIDLPESPEAFYKQMYRKEEFWKIFNSSDKN
jgi:hypothetical protein